MADKFGSLESVISDLQAKYTNYGVSMGLKTDLRALVSGKEDAEIDTAFAGLGFFPKSTADAPDVDKIKADAMAEGATGCLPSKKKEKLYRPEWLI